ncbi:MAG: acetyl-CoA carboxylase biotin carboxyl carrier protein subunit [Longicatena sp.]
MNTENIKEIIKVFEDSHLAKMELEIDDMKIKMEKPNGVLMPQEYVVKAPTTETKEIEAQLPKSGNWVKAPIVGTYYDARAAKGTPFVEIGKHVKEGDVLCIIEAMKVMNEIYSPMDGIIQEILVTNESMVEFDQELMRIGEAHD